MATSTAHVWRFSSPSGWECAACGATEPATAYTVPTYGCTPPTAQSPAQLTLGGPNFKLSPAQIGLDKALDNLRNKLRAEAPEPTRPQCFECAVELSSTLDAYYGHDSYLKKLCCECRGRQ